MSKQFARKGIASFTLLFLIAATSITALSTLILRNQPQTFQSSASVHCTALGSVSVAGIPCCQAGVVDPATRRCVLNLNATRTPTPRPCTPIGQVLVTGSRCCSGGAPDPQSQNRCVLDSRSPTPRPCTPLGQQPQNYNNLPCCQAGRVDPATGRCVLNLLPTRTRTPTPPCIALGQVRVAGLSCCSNAQVDPQTGRCVLGLPTPTPLSCTTNGACCSNGKTCDRGFLGLGSGRCTGTSCTPPTPTLVPGCKPNGTRGACSSLTCCVPGTERLIGMGTCECKNICEPGAKRCSTGGGYSGIDVCKSDGSGWVARQFCSSGCNPDTLSCTLGIGQNCTSSSNCTSSCCTFNSSRNSYTCSASCTTINLPLNQTSMTRAEFNSYIGKSCNSLTARNLFTGSVPNGDNTDTCSLKCIGGRVTLGSCIRLPATPQYETFCSGTRVVMRGIPTYLQDCGTQRRCNSSVCWNESLCKEGKCMVGVGGACTREEEIRPNAASPNSYLQCRGGRWQTFFQGVQFDFNQNCPNNWRNDILNYMSEFQNALVPDERSIPINCYEYNSEYAGAVYSNGYSTNRLLEIACGDPTNSEWCRIVMAHEFGHIQANSAYENSANNTAFNQAFGCRRDPNNSNLYTLTVERPVSTYAQTNCAEMYAEAVASYVVGSCNMRVNFPQQYQWLRSNVFSGEEYCDSSFRPCSQRNVNSCQGTAGCAWTGSSCVDSAPNRNCTNYSDATTCRARGCGWFDCNNTCQDATRSISSVCGPISVPTALPCTPLGQVRTPGSYCCSGGVVDPNTTRCVLNISPTPSCVQIGGTCNNSTRCCGNADCFFHNPRLSTGSCTDSRSVPGCINSGCTPGKLRCALDDQLQECRESACNTGSGTTTVTGWYTILNCQTAVNRACTCGNGCTSRDNSGACAR